MTDVVSDPQRLAALVADLRIKNAQLEEALASRIVIEQAKGILAERYRLDVENAFEVLRGAARTNRIRLHELAVSVVELDRTPNAIERELVRARRALNGN